MYDTLATTELILLQSILYEGAEEAYRVACLTRANPARYGHHRAVHAEVGLLFIEAGSELLERLATKHASLVA